MVGYCTRQPVHDDFECASSPTGDDNISLPVYTTVSVGLRCLPHPHDLLCANGRLYYKRSWTISNYRAAEHHLISHHSAFDFVM